MSSRRGGRGMRRGRDGPSLSDADQSWRSSSSHPISQGLVQNRGRGKGSERSTRGRVISNPNEIAEVETLFSSLNKEIISTFKLSRLLDTLQKLDSLLSDSVRRMNGLAITWSNHLEDFVLFLKRLLVAMDERFVAIHYFDTINLESSEGLESLEILAKFPGRVCQVLHVICNGILPGKDSYSLLHLLVSKTSANTYCLAQLFGFKTTAKTNQALKFHPSIPYNPLLDLLISIIVKSKSILAFAERKSLFATGEGSYTSFSQDMACILEDLIYLSMKLITSKRANTESNLPDLNEGTAWTILMNLAAATPFNRLPSSLLHTLCRFIDSLYQLQGNLCECGLSRGVLAVILQNDGVQLEDLKSLLEIKEIESENAEIQTNLGNGIASVSGISIFQDFLQSLATTFSMLDRRDVTAHVHLKDSSPVSEYMQIFVGLTKYKFKEFRITFLHIIHLVRPILLRSEHLEKVLRARGYQGAKLEEAVDKCLPGITLTFLGNFMTAVSEYVKGEFDVDYVASVGQQWFKIIQVFPKILDLGSWTLGCLALDAMSAVHEDLFSRLPVEAQEKTLSFIVNVGVLESNRPEIRAKSGRCLALMFDFQMLVEQSEPLWFTLNCIGRSLNSEHLQVRTSWAWALGKWSDALEKHHTNGETPDELENSVLHVLKLIHVCSNDVLKIRYNGYRTAANVFKWMPDAALEFPKVRKEISNTIDTLIAQIGHGIDYKARWNAVYAVGCVFENAGIMNEMASTVLAQSLPTLCTWVAQSQNYKERIQCAVAIRKIHSRGLFKDHYHTVWHRICLAVTRLPVEDIDLAQKLKCEVTITLAELSSLMEPKDLVGMEQILSEHGESLKSLFLDTHELIPSERRECLNRARDRVMSLRPHQSSDGVIDTLRDILHDYASAEESVD